MPELPESIPVVGAEPARSTTRRASSPLARWGFGIFVVGLLAVAVIMVLFATGSHDLPLWLNLAAMLAPIGFGVGLFGVFLEARSARTPAAEPVGEHHGLFPTGSS